ncbi:MAG: hypothetical protein M0R03_03310 [Novosphingobium sp.]|nr:hypothetical protein [Novosphingobium sp.]
MSFAEPDCFAAMMSKLKRTQPARWRGELLPGRSFVLQALPAVQRLARRREFSVGRWDWWAILSLR